ncbi:serine/threonine protein kinase, variant 1 [Aphanomyces invadans]|uniref:Serine/threonine protein kinase, variant 1 n=1 Tax=Aphanomyces invadans TaxID=157072 RepID=A0A024TZA9_9STRA|nr:serine/threonine protein kinase, variant 1 [Aphanomyces invadans]ETV99338.1 serine/threonine protein kinase, variant 1 [Aphanomyces invadans]|eukprot:XP_008871894.1 serine/threonine protein kinase, variant 1 [Aphanomyces invadans]
MPRFAVVCLVREGLLDYVNSNGKPRSRWFVLDGAQHAMTKYTSPDRSKQLGPPIHILGARIERGADLSFTVHLHQRYRSLKRLTYTAHSHDEKEAWMQSLINCINGMASGLAKRMCHRGVLNGQYIFVRELGRGASGVVYLYTYHGKPCAVKKLPTKATKFNHHGQLTDAVKREIALLKKATNLPHVVSLYDVIQARSGTCRSDSDGEDGNVYLVMEFLGGGPIAAYDKVQKRFTTKQHMVDADFKRLMRCATIGLKYLHSHHLVHRDIKPDNILMTDDFSECKLADLGVAHWFEPAPTSVGIQKQDCSIDPRLVNLSSKVCENATALTSTDTVPPPPTPHASDTLDDTKGTYEFLSPEAISGDAYSGFAADVWALGVTLYAVVVGKLPFQADSVLALFDQIAEKPVEFPPTVALSVDVRDLITRMLVKDPARRMTVDEVLAHPWLCTSSTKSMLMAPAKLVVDDDDVHAAVSPLQAKFDMMRRASPVDQMSMLTTVECPGGSAPVSPPAFTTARHRPHPIDIASIALPPVLASELPTLAQQLHFQWCFDKVLAGWSYGPHRNDDLKLHPLLKPFWELDDGAQTRNRVSVEASLKCILALGYTVTRKPNAHQYVPASLARIALPGELVVLGDLLAENDHEVWATEYVRNGWTVRCRPSRGT